MPQKRSFVAQAVTSPAARITLTYLAVNCGWILLSDWLCFSLLDRSLLPPISMLKGCLSVSLSAVLLYLFISRYFARQEQSRQLVAANEERYRTIFEMAGVGVAVVDCLSDRFLQTNQKFCAIVGYGADELRQKTFLDLTHPDDVQQEVAQNDLFRKGASPPLTWEKRYLHRSGRTVHVRVILSRMWTEGEEPTVQLAVVQDVTGAKEAEAALHDAKQRLEERVLERTAELERANRALEEEIAERRRAEEALSRNVSDLKSAERSIADLNRELQQRVEELRLHRDHLDTLVKARTDELAARNAQLAVEIEERRSAQMVNNATIRLLRLCNEARTAAQLARDLVGFFRECTGCDGAGIRLGEKGDYPYGSAEGFTGDFVRQENLLCATEPGAAPRLSCLCGIVISGAPPAQIASSFTPSGSFWTNCAATFASGLEELCLSHPFRKRCLEEGYLSIALIPLRSQGEIFGLVQLNARREGAFTPETLALAETLVSYASIALAKLRSDEALHESARALREAQQIAKIGSYRYDYAGDRWTSSEMLDEIFGIGAGYQRSAAGWYALVHPADREALRAYAAEAKARGDNFNREFRIARPADGSERWVHLVAELEYAEDGRPLQVMGTIQDVTRRKQGEEALRASEGRFRTLIERAPVAIGIFRVAEIVYANGKFLDMFGFESVDEIRGRSVAVLSAPRHRDALVQRALLRAEGVPVPNEYEGAAWHRERGEFPVQVAATPVHLADGVATIAFLYDITERKNAEEAVRRYTRRLMELEEELRRRIASELHDDIGQELTALGLNLSYVGSALKEERPELTVRLEDSRQIARGISRTVRNMMTELRPSQLDELGLAAALSSHAELFRSRTGIAVAVNAAEALPPLAVEAETALFRIVQEAFTNVAKHAEASVVTVSLVPEGEGVRLTISDDGRGFVAGEVSAGGGAGWGLTVMRERAALVGGSFTVDSAPGEGTRVVVVVGGER